MLLAISNKNDILNDLERKSSTFKRYFAKIFDQTHVIETESLFHISQTTIFRFFSLFLIYKTTEKKKIAGKVFEVKFVLYISVGHGEQL